MIIKKEDPKFIPTTFTITAETQEELSKLQALICGLNGLILTSDNGEQIEVYPKNLDGAYSWNDAIAACEALGDGWHLPTKEELNLLFSNKEKIDGFKEGAYWSCSEYSTTGAWAQYWYSGNPGYQDGYSKTAAYYVRAVRRSVL
jgi:hypothetical protein